MKSWGRSSPNGISTLYKKRESHQSILSLPYTQLEGGCLKARKRVLTKNSICPQLELGFPASRNVRHKFLLFKLSCLRYSAIIVQGKTPPFYLLCYCSHYFFISPTVNLLKILFFICVYIKLMPNRKIPKEKPGEKECSDNFTKG